MFKDLRKGFTVGVLDKSGDILSYKTGTVVDAGAPRCDLPKNQLPQMGQPMPQYNAERVIDLTVEIEGKTDTYVVSEHGSIASSPTITLACDTTLIANEVQAIMKRNQDEIDKYDQRLKTKETCEQILASLNPVYADSKEQNARIDRLEKSIGDVSSTLDEIKKLLVGSSTSSKTSK